MNLYPFPNEGNHRPLHLGLPTTLPIFGSAPRKASFRETRPKHGSGNFSHRIGLIQDETSCNHPVCLEPEECGYHPSDFSSFRERTAKNLANDGKGNLMSTHPKHNRSIQRSRLWAAQQKAMLELVGEFSPESPEPTEFFFAGPTSVGIYDVGIVFKLTGGAKISRYQLPVIYAEDRYGVPNSLVTASARRFLNKCIGSLNVPEPSKVEGLYDIDCDEILREAGSKLMIAPVFASNGFEGLYGLFNACNYIASLNYEGAESQGGLLIAETEHPNLEYILKLKSPVNLNNHRRIRKLLEITGSGESLITNGDEVTGVGRITGNYDPDQANLFKVLFMGHHRWEIFHGPHSLMQVAYGLPSLRQELLEETRFREAFEILFQKDAGEEAGELFSLALAACEQAHGTVLVITPDAEAEAVRLAKQSTPIEPIKMTAEILKSVSSIDGAVLLDLDGTCYAIGVILDGIATAEGDPGRGARYNSSLRYYSYLKSRNIPCLTILVSEDRTSEIVPDLPFRLSRELLDEKTTLMTCILGKDHPEHGETHDILRWFSDHRFYLSDGLCSTLNRLIETYKNIPRPVGVITMQQHQFVPHPEMSELFLV